MAIDIFSIQENVISRDLKGKFICIYGPELFWSHSKCGKNLEP